MIEHFTDEIDIVQDEDGTWRAERYPKAGSQISSRFDSYPSRAAVLFAMRHDKEFWANNR